MRCVLIELRKVAAVWLLAAIYRLWPKNDVPVLLSIANLAEDMGRS